MNQNDKQVLAALLLAGLMDTIPAPKTAAAAEVILIAARALEDIVLGLHPTVDEKNIDAGVAFLATKLTGVRPNLN